MSGRSSLRETRNPLLALPAAARLQSLDPMTRLALRSLLLDLRNDARARSEQAWRKHKGPMAVYWKAVGVYANHLARVLS